MRKNCGSEGLFSFNGILVVRGCKIVIIIYFKGSFIQAVASDSLEQACKPQRCASSKLFLLLSSLFKGFHSMNNNISGHWPVCSMQRPPWRKEQSFYRSVGATSGPANMLTYLHIFQKNLKFFLLTVWLRLVWWTLPHAHISVKGPFTVCRFVLRLSGFSRILDFVFLFVFVISNWPVYAAGWVGANIPPSSSSVMAVDSNKVAAPEGDWCITNNVQLFIRF